MYGSFRTEIIARSDHGPSKAIAFVCTHKLIGVMHDEQRIVEDSEGMTNLRLIAAAPEMLDALHALLNALPSATTHPAIQKARRVIAKAEGRQ